MRRAGISRILLCFLLLTSCGVLGQGTNEPPAKLSVKGYGFFGDRELKSLLDVLKKPGEKPLYFDANYIEDAILMLYSRLERSGYLHPRITVQAELENGEKKTFEWTQPLGPPLPRPLRARRPMIDMKIWLLPEPDSPTTPSVSPFWIEKSTPPTAFTAPSWVAKLVLRPVTSRTAAIAVSDPSGRGRRAGRRR